MKNKFVCYLATFFFSLSTSAGTLYCQGTLYEIYPKLPLVEYFGVYFFNPDTGLAVGEAGVIIKTTDGGKSWVQKSSTTNNTLWKIQAFSYNNIFICGLNGILLYSNDGGENWIAINLNVGNNLLSLKVIDEQTGWLCGSDSILFKTTNGGNAWFRKTTGFQGVYRDIDFYDANLGYICSTSGFLVTENGGESWGSKIYGGFNTVEPLTDSIVIAGSPTGHIFYSEDRGTSWTIVNTAWSSNIQSIEMVNDTLGYASALFTNGYYFTTDGGLSWDWKVERIGNSQITFVNEYVGYGVGTDLTLTKTTDRGNTWKRLIINDGINAICFIDEMNGFLSADMMYSFEDIKQVYYSSDGGYSWENVENFELLLDNVNTIIAFPDNLNGFIGAYGGIIYKSTNAGANWYLSDTTSIVIGFESPPLVDFAFYNNYGWALISGYQGSRVKKTTNLGAEWNLLPTEFSDRLNNIFFYNELNGWITGQDYFGSTTDGGISWIKNTSLNYSYYQDVFFSNLNNGWLTIDSNRTLRTTNGGLTWQSTGLKGGTFIIVDNNNIYLTSDKALYYSSNNGNSWELRLDSTNAIELSTLPEVNDGWGINGNKIIMKYDDLITNLGEESYFILQENTLFQNYPNPFNPITTIKYKILETTFVNISLFNITGRKVKELVSEKKQPGVYTLDMKGGELSSGVYFYRLVTDSGYEVVKKMLLIK